MRPGRGFCGAHHGEVLQGVFEGADGRLRRALVTLPCSVFGSEAVFVPDRSGELSVEPETRTKALRAAELALARCGAPAGAGGKLRLSGGVLVGRGMGSSTADVVAGVRAVAAAFGREFSPMEVAGISVSSETASDPLMFDGRALLFAHREGVVVEDLGGELPALEVVGFDCDPDGDGVETLRRPPARYTRAEVEAFGALIRTLRRAVRERDARLVGEVASESARINQSRLPKPHFERLAGISEETGAAGVSVAHSGSVAALLFAPEDGEAEKRVDLARKRLTGLGLPSWRFRAGCRGSKRLSERRLTGR